MVSASAAVPLAMTGGAANLQPSIDQLEAFAAAAPAEIRDDLKTVAAGYAKVAKVLQDSGYIAGQPLSPAAIQAFQKVSTELDNATFKAATDRVTNWFDKECDS
jgi:glutathione S-transferase